MEKHEQRKLAANLEVRPRRFSELNAYNKDRTFTVTIGYSSSSWPNGLAFMNATVWQGPRLRQMEVGDLSVAFSLTYD